MALAAPTGAWASLPPIQRTVGDAPVVAPSAPFLDEVPGHRHLPPIVQPLGHETGPAAPPGLVLARPSAVPSLTSQAPMPLHRRESGATAREPGAEMWAEPAPSEPAVTEPAQPPVRRLPAVAASASVTPAPRPLTQAPASVAPIAQRSPARTTGTPGAPAAASSVAPATAPGADARPLLPTPRGTAPSRVSRWAERPGSPVSPAGLGAPLADTRASAPAPETAATTSAGPSVSRSVSSPSTPPTPAVAHTETTAIRRSRLGPPLRESQPGASTPGLPLAAPRGRHRGAQEGDAGPDATAGTGPPSSSPAAGVAAPRPLPVLPVARGTTATPPTATGEAPAGTAQPAATTPPPWHPVAGPTPGAPATPSRPPLLPLLGARPLRPSVVVSRQAEAGSPVPAPPVAARWAPGLELPATVGTLPAIDAEMAGVPLQPLPAGTTGTPSATAAPATPAAPDAMREIVFPARDGSTTATVSRSSAPTPPVPAVPHAPVVPALQRTPSPGAVAPAGRPAPAPALTLARPPAPQAAAAPQPAPAAPVVARIVSDPAHPGGPATFRPGAGPDPLDPGRTVGAITATPVIQREAAGQAPATPGDSDEHGDAELDELARALFGRIRGHLRAEVINEREAKGLGFDAF